MIKVLDPGKTARTAELSQAASPVGSVEGRSRIALGCGTVWGVRILGDADKACFRTRREEAYYRDTARTLKSRISATIILTGGIRSYEVAEALVAEGTADYIGLCRPFIREPDRKVISVVLSTGLELYKGGSRQ